MSEARDILADVIVAAYVEDRLDALHILDALLAHPVELLALITEPKRCETCGGDGKAQWLASCSECGGLGLDPLHNDRVCSRCGGSCEVLVVRDDVPCPACNGMGSVAVDVLDLLVQAGLAPDTYAGLAQENDDLHADLVKALHVRNLALEEAATDFQHGGDGQDYIDRGRMIHRWLESAYENYDAGETITHPPSSFAAKDGTP